MVCRNVLSTFFWGGGALHVSLLNISTSVFLPLQPGDNFFPADENNMLISDGSNFLDTWEVSALVKQGD